MEEKEMIQMFDGTFRDVIPVLEEIKHGFLTQNQVGLTEAETKLSTPMCLTGQQRQRRDGPFFLDRQCDRTRPPSQNPTSMLPS